MTLTKTSCIALCALALGLGGCASSPGYYEHDNYSYNDHGHHGDRCEGCGTVENIDLVRYGEGRRTSGGGALLGALVGGALGNQVGKGDGRKAATIGGAVVGGIAGNEIEKNQNRDDLYEISVRMDDGRTFTVEQYRLNGIREGSRVLVTDGVASLL